MAHAESSRPPKFKYGEECRDCKHYSSQHCTLYNWRVAAEDWCSSYDPTTKHLAAWKLKESKEQS